MRPPLKRGVDLSEFNGDVDMELLKQNGVEFVILRCGYGGDFPHQDDEQFQKNVDRCTAAGLPWGAYLYSYAQAIAMAEDEAAHVLRLLQKNPAPDYGVWYDVEDESLPTAPLLGELCKTFCRKIENAGYQAGIYTFLSWLEQTDRLAAFSSSPELNGYPLWYAQFNDEIDYAYPDRIDIWQYSDRVEIGGKIFDGDAAYTAFSKASQQKPAPKNPSPKTEKRYRYLEDIPEWGRAAIQYYMDGGLLQGVGKDGSGRTILDLSEDLVRLYVAMKRERDREQERGDS